MRGKVVKAIRNKSKSEGKDYKKLKGAYKTIRRSPKKLLAPKHLLMIHFNREMPSAYKRPLKSYRHIMKVENAKAIVDRIVNKHPEHLNIDSAVWYDDKRNPSVIYEKPKPKLI